MTRPTPGELEELERWVKNSYQSVVKTEIVLQLIAACRERDEAKAQGRREAFMEAAATCNELAALSDPDTDESAGLKKAARAVQALDQHRDEAGGTE